MEPGRPGECAPVARAVRALALGRFRSSPNRSHVLGQLLADGIIGCIAALESWNTIAMPDPRTFCHPGSSRPAPSPRSGRNPPRRARGSRFSSVRAVRLLPEPLSPAIPTISPIHLQVQPPDDLTYPPGRGSDTEVLDCSSGASVPHRAPPFGGRASREPVAEEVEREYRRRIARPGMMLTHHFERSVEPAAIIAPHSGAGGRGPSPGRTARPAGAPRRRVQAGEHDGGADAVGHHVAAQSLPRAEAEHPDGCRNSDCGSRDRTSDHPRIDRPGDEDQCQDGIPRARAECAVTTMARMICGKANTRSVSRMRTSSTPRPT